MTTHEFQFSVHDLDAAGKTYRFPLRASWVRGALEGHEATAAGPDGELEVRASKSGSDVVIHGHLEAHLSVPCARCLEPTPVRVRERISALFVPTSQLRHDAAGRRGGGGKEGGDDDDGVILSSEDADVLPFDGDTVVLDDLVRDELVLETPMIPLCKEDCPGIHPGLASAAPEAVRPVDPRLAPLLRLKESASKDKS